MLGWCWLGHVTCFGQKDVRARDTSRFEMHLHSRFWVLALLLFTINMPQVAAGQEGGEI